MIIGIGTDIVEISRIKKTLENDKFIKRVFTEAEIRFAEKTERQVEIYAGTFASKEAVSKALGTGLRKFNLIDIEVLRDELGKPYVILHKNAKTLFDKLKAKELFLSISHSNVNCVSFCVIEG